jgi:hypothetical protein
LLWTLIVSLAISRDAAPRDLAMPSVALTSRAARRSAAVATVSRPRLRVDLVLDGAVMPPGLEATAMEEVARIWAPYGVDVRAPDGNHDVGRHDAVRLAVRLADRSDGHATAMALGSIQFLGDLPEPAIVMYPKAIDKLVSGVTLYGRTNRQWPSAFRDFIVGRVLGRALAHEIGHFLLRSRHHSAAGLMQSDLAAPDLVGADRRRFVLSAEEAARLDAVTRSE